MQATENVNKTLDAALAHVPFDGWSAVSFAAALEDTGVAPELARALLPRGAVDLAMAFHRRGDAQLAEALQKADLGDMRFRDRIAYGVRLRLDIAAPHKEAVRRGTTLFALPNHAADGTRCLWETADTIWTALGDTSDDVNWYTKRMTLSGVHAATTLFWLGDDSPDHEATWAFLDRRIDNVMQIEGAKATIRKSPVLKGIFAGPMWLMGRIKAPAPTPDMPGKHS